MGQATAPASSSEVLHARWLLGAYAAALSAAFLIVLPLAWVGRELATFRNWQIGIHAVFALVLLVRPGIRRALSAAVPPRWAFPVLASGALTSFLLGSLSLYFAFDLSGVDFSIFDWMLWSTAHGRFMYTPIYDVNHFGTHPSYVMLPLVPLHQLFESPFLLLLVGPLVLWAAIFPLRALARALLMSEAYALLATAAYLGCVWIDRLRTGGFRIEVFFPVFGLLFALGWVRREQRFWIAGLVGLLATKEDAPLYLGALAVAGLVLERNRWREEVAVLVSSVLILGLDVGIVQPWCRGPGPTHDAAFERFWGQYGDSLGSIATHMLARPWQPIGAVLTSGWWKFFGPLLFLPLLGRLPLAAMMPGLLMLGASGYASMRRFDTYHAIALLPFLLWALFEAWSRLRPRVRDPMFLAALLVFPICFGDHFRVLPPRWESFVAEARIRQKLAGLEGPLSVQTILFPHVPYRRDTMPLFDASPPAGNAALVAPQLSPYPGTSAQWEQLVAKARAEHRIDDLGGGIFLLGPERR